MRRGIIWRESEGVIGVGLVAWRIVKSEKVVGGREMRCSAVWCGCYGL